MDGQEERSIGRRLRQVRYWRRMSLKATAELAGISEGYLSRIERGQRPVERRKLVEALAGALRVSPADLTGQPYPPTNQSESDAHAAAQALRAVLRDIEIDAPVLFTAPRAVEALRPAVSAVATACDDCDYTALGKAVPALIAELYTLATERDSGEARRMLAEVLHAAFYLSKDLGHGDLAWMVSAHLQRAADAIGDPVWGAVASFVRSHATVGLNARQAGLILAEQGAELVEPDAGESGQVYGMLHLSAALQSAVTGNPGGSRDHLEEAAGVASRTGNGSFAGLHFGPRNVGVWRVALALELGEPGRVAELARQVDVSAIQSAGRQATFYGDVGRGLAGVRGQEEKAIEALCRAEVLAPHRTHANPFVREAVTDLIRRARRDAGGRELRGLAHRMGLGVA